MLDEIFQRLTIQTSSGHSSILAILAMVVRYERHDIQVETGLSGTRYHTVERAKSFRRLVIAILVVHGIQHSKKSQILFLPFILRSDVQSRLPALYSLGVAVIAI